MFCLALIFLVTFSLFYTPCKCFTYVVKAEIHSYRQSNFSLTCLAHLQYVLILVSFCFLAVSRLALLITHIYHLVRSTKLDTQATFTIAVLFAIALDSFLLTLAFFAIITSFIAIIVVCRTLFFQICKSYSFFFFVIERFNKIFMHHFAIVNIVV